MKRKDKIKKLMKTDSSFRKGRIWTKLIVVLALLLIGAMQAYMFMKTGTLLQEALIHLGLQSLCVLLILSGKRLFIWLYTLAMIASLPLTYLLYEKTPSEFYLVQMIFFGASLFLMLILVFSKYARHYRRKLRNLKHLFEEEPVEETVEEVQEEPEIVEEPVVAETPVAESEPQKEFIELSGPETLNLTYGHFSRFLVQYYPFVYLHPKFNPETNPTVQMCISAEGFDKESDELYSGIFYFNVEKTETASIHLEYEDEMGHLCALICADWLVMQKATFMKDGVNISAELMKQLTEAFVLAKDAQKAPFEGFNKI